MRRRLLFGFVGLALVTTACTDGDEVAQPSPSTQPAAATTPSPSSPAASPPPTNTRTPAPTPKVGDCGRLSDHDGLLGVSFGTSRRVPCKDGHDAQTYAVSHLSQSLRRTVRQGDVVRLYAAASARCRARLAHWLGGNGADTATSQFDFVVGVPTVTEIADGATWLRCDAVAHRTRHSLVRLTGSTSGVLDSRRAQRYRTCVFGSIAAAHTVLRSHPHRWRAAAALRLGPPHARYPGGKSATMRMRAACEKRVRAYLDTRRSFRYGWIRPTKGTWQRGDRFGVCFAHLPS